MIDVIDIHKKWDSASISLGSNLTQNHPSLLLKDFLRCTVLHFEEVNAMMHVLLLMAVQVIDA